MFIHGNHASRLEEPEKLDLSNRIKQFLLLSYQSPGVNLHQEILVESHHRITS